MAKKRKRRRNRDQHRRYRNLTAIFYALYPNAPDDIAGPIVEYALAADFFDERRFPSNTAAIEQATLAYVREHFTDYGQTLDGYMETILQSIEAGQPYQGKTPEALEQAANTQARDIIAAWR
jgi:hypothetical protein